MTQQVGFKASGLGGERSKVGTGLSNDGHDLPAFSLRR